MRQTGTRIIIAGCIGLVLGAIVGRTTDNVLTGLPIAIAIALAVAWLLKPAEQS